MILKKTSLKYSKIIRVVFFCYFSLSLTHSLTHSRQIYWRNTNYNVPAAINWHSKNPIWQIHKKIFIIHRFIWCVVKLNVRNPSWSPSIGWNNHFMAKLGNYYKITEYELIQIPLRKFKMAENVFNDHHELLSDSLKKPFGRTHEGKKESKLPEPNTNWGKICGYNFFFPFKKSGLFRTVMGRYIRLSRNRNLDRTLTNLTGWWTAARHPTVEERLLEPLYSVEVLIFFFLFIFSSSRIVIVVELLSCWADNLTLPWLVRRYLVLHWTYNFVCVAYFYEL